ncbi:MAG: hypothetical protein JJU37_15990 [Balneolaceae bacterium]|nr:hypothetical protein [Balneolaceae bacterium]
MTQFLQSLKVITLLLVLLFSYSISAFAQTATAPSGSGTSGSPYLVETLENLVWVSQNTSSWGSNFIQTANIDLISISNWSPIGSSSSAFTGVYDGDGYVIRNLTINRPDTNYQGLFGNSGNAMIRNVRIENVDIRGNRWVGGLTGRITGSVENSSVTGIVRASREYVGGIVGQGTNASLDNRLVFIGDVIGAIVATDSGTSVGIGGIVGRSSGSTSLSIAYVRGSVRGNYAGGVVGSSSTANSIFSQIYSAVIVTAPSGQNLGGAVVGRVESSGDVINNSVYWDSSLYSNAYGLITSGSTRNAIGLTTIQMQGADAETNMSNLDWNSSGPWRTVTQPEVHYPVFEWQIGEEITISGNVTALNKTNISGITVTAQVGDVTFEDVSTTTDGSGNYSFNAYTVPTQRVFARASDDDGLPIGAAVEGPFTETTIINLNLQPRSLTISSAANNGWVKDGNEILAVEANARLNVNTLRDELLAGDVTVVAGIDIEVNNDITINLSTTRSLTLKAGGSVYIQSESSITATGEALNTIIWTRSAGNNSADDGRLGTFWMPVGSALNTNGGFVTIGGGEDPATGFALGATDGPSGENNARFRGVTVNGTIDAAGGNINMLGRGRPTSTHARGVSIGGTITTSDNGNINISGIAKGVSDGFALGDTHFSTNPGRDGNVTTQFGDITLSGTRDTGNQ